MRYRLIPTRGRTRVEHVYGELAGARAHAEQWARSLEMPVGVYEAPEGGLVRHVVTVPVKTKREKRAA